MYHSMNDFKTCILYTVYSIAMVTDHKSSNISDIINYSGPRSRTQFHLVTLVVAVVRSSLVEFMNVFLQRSVLYEYLQTQYDRLNVVYHLSKGKLRVRHIESHGHLL